MSNIVQLNWTVISPNVITLSLYEVYLMHYKVCTNREMYVQIVQGLSYAL